MFILVKRRGKATLEPVGGDLFRKIFFLFVNYYRTFSITEHPVRPRYLLNLLSGVFIIHMNRQ
jgi:hypothetical protein